MSERPPPIRILTVDHHRGKSRGALVKYDEALKYAPNLAALKEAREAAAKQKR